MIECDGVPLYVWGKVILVIHVLFMPALVTSIGSVLFMTVVVTSVGPEVDCVVETPVGDHSITDLLTPVTDTVNYMQYKEYTEHNFDY